MINQKRTRQIKRLLERIGIINKLHCKLDTDTVEKKLKYEIIDEALTHTSAQLKINHERLEFLGDAVLRLAASEFIDQEFPTMKVGDRSELRSHLVSDQWLAEVGRSMNIKEVFIVGTKASHDLHASATLEAEATEALIGGLFQCLRDLQIIKLWLSPYWQKTSVQVLADPHKKNPKSALQEWSQSTGNSLPTYHSVEKSQRHGDPKRFFCKVNIKGKNIGQGWGKSIQDAEKMSALNALRNLNTKD